MNFGPKKPAPEPAKPKAELSAAALSAAVLANEWLESSMLELFHRYDENGDGYLQKDELAEVLLELELPAAPADIAAAFGSFDADGDGSISFSEFCSSYNALKDAQAAIMKARNSEDTDNLAPEAAQIAAEWRQALLQYNTGSIKFHFPSPPEDEDTPNAEAKSTPLIARLLRGHATLEELERLDCHPVMRIFVSSTFRDTQFERNFWHAHVWPSLTEHCESLGLDLDIIDLRWGVSNAHTDDHATTELCLSEVQRCSTTSVGISFIFLSGQRYGWRALPRELPVEEFNKLRSLVPPDSPTLLVIDCWYRLDNNSLPPRYLLRTITEVKSDPAVPEPFRDFFDREVGGRTVLGAEKLMASAFREAVGKADLDSDRQAAWMLSVTAKEVREAVRLGITPDRAVLVKRTIDGLSRKGKDGNEVSALEMHSAVPEDRPLLERLRDVDTLAFSPKRTFLELTHWTGAAYDTSFVLANAVKLYGLLARDVTLAAQRPDVAELPRRGDEHRREVALEREVVAHAAMAARRAKSFLGRGELVQRLVALATPSMDGNKLGVVHGKSGCGKTSLIANVAAHSGSEGITLVRFAGTSNSSSTARGVLRSLCNQLKRCCGRSAHDILHTPDKLHELGSHFEELLKSCKATADRPLRIFIDSLDQLSDDEAGKSRLFDWLPCNLPPHVSLTVSLIADDSILGATLMSQFLDVGHVDDAHFVEVQALSTDETEHVLNGLLAAHGRTVTLAQRAALLAAARTGDGGDPTILKMRLLAAEGARLSSWHNWPPIRPAPHVPPPPTGDLLGRSRGKTSTAQPAPPRKSLPVATVPPSPPASAWLPTSVPDLIDLLFERLERTYTRTLTSRVLGLIAACRAGLSRANLLDFLSGSDDVLGALGKKDTVFEHGAPPTRRCPQLVFTRLLHGLRDFVSERGGAGGLTVLSFYHRQFAEAAKRRYLNTEPDKAQLYGLLADLFSGRLAAKFPCRGIDSHSRQMRPYNLPLAQQRMVRSPQALVELPAALLKLGDLTGALVRQARPVELVRWLTSPDFIYASASDGRVGDLVTHLACATQQVDKLGKAHLARAAELRQAGRADGNESLRAGERWAKPKTAASAKLSPAEALRKAEEVDVEAASTRAQLTALSETFRWARQIAFQLRAIPESAYLEALNAPTGSAPQRAVHGLIEGDGLDLTGSWELVTKPTSFSACLAVFEGHKEVVRAIAFSADGYAVASASDDKSLRLWFASTGELLRTLKYHTKKVNSVAFSPDNAYLASCSDDLMTVLWNAGTGERIKEVKGTSIQLCCCFSKDGHLMTIQNDRSVQILAFEHDNLVPCPPLIVSEANEGLGSLSISSDDEFMAVSGPFEKFVWVFSRTTLEVIRRIEPRAHTWAVAFSNDASRPSRLALGTKGTGVTGRDLALVYDMADETTPPLQLEHDAPVSSVSFSHDDDLLITGAWDNVVRIYAMPDGRLLKKLIGHTDKILCTSVSSDSTQIISGGMDRTIRLWKSGTLGELLRSSTLFEGEEPALKSFTESATCIALSPDGAWAASSTANSKNVVLLWNVHTGAELASLETLHSDARELLFNADGSQLAVLTADLRLYVFSTASGKLLRDPAHASKGFAGLFPAGPPTNYQTRLHKAERFIEILSDLFGSSGPPVQKMLVFPPGNSPLIAKIIYDPSTGDWPLLVVIFEEGRAAHYRAVRGAAQMAATAPARSLKSRDPPIAVGMTRPRNLRAQKTV